LASDATSSVIVAPATPAVAADHGYVLPADAGPARSVVASSVVASSVVAGALRLAPAEVVFSAFQSVATHPSTGAFAAAGEGEMLVRASAAKSAAADLAWLPQIAGSDNSDQQPKRIAAIQALDALFAQYGRAGAHSV
jgi:hypothetical protein